VRLLLVDDDPGLRALLRTTLEVVDIDVDEAESALEADELIRTSRPDAVVLDVGMPGMDGLSFCRKLRADPATSEIPVVLLTGMDDTTQEAASAAGVNAFLRKPFSPLELLGVVERLAGGLTGTPFRALGRKAPDEQLLLYARDLRHLLEIERGQRLLLQKAYQETVMALATALESKDTGTRAHSQRVQRYAIELTRELKPEIAGDQSTQYGFLLHDVGKIGIPDKILQKPRPLTEGERRLMRTHTVLGEQMLGGVAFLQGEGLRVVRHHHERWDGRGYPDGLMGSEIPVGARIFAVADALDAMTSNRPYRPARAWDEASDEIVSQARRQFDPDVVDAFLAREPQLRQIRRELTAA
jgi:response regulator RpfG family c-di-GMP phosphodiesterase